MRETAKEEHDLYLHAWSSSTILTQGLPLVIIGLFECLTFITLRASEKT